MYLTEEEQKMLDGEKGPGCKFAMEILAAVGDAFGAEKMVPVRSAHTILSTYKGIRDAGIEAIEKFVALGAKAAIPTTTDPAGMDLERWTEFRVHGFLTHCFYER